MKKILSIILLILVAACVKEDLIDYSYYTQTEIFTQEGTILKDATPIEFNLDSADEYIITLTDEFTSKTITKESFKGQKGVNTLSIFTKVVPKGSYFLTLTDKNGNKVQQTKISI